MNRELLGALAALANIGSFLIDAARVVFHLCKRISTRRMARKEDARKASETK